jgi:hypothetical protein
MRRGIGKRGVWSAIEQEAVLRPSWVTLKRKWLGGCAASALTAFLFGTTHVAEAQPRSLYGSVGLIDMPTARMARDGEFSVSAAFYDNSQRYTLSFQALSWLEGSFRYTGLEDYHPSFPVYWDRAFGLKIRLWDEGTILPSVAVGTNDLVGTGLYSSEFVVASKSFGNVDVSLGVGWGRMATANTFRNPLGLLSSSFDQRSANIGLGGDFDFGRYFHGRRAGFFGGISWRAPVEGLTLLAEFSSDKYLEEATTGTFAPVNQFNLGASYHPSESVTLGLGWLYGRSFYGNVTLSLDPTANPYATRLGPPLPPLSVRTQEEQNGALSAARDQRRRGPGAAVDDRLVDTLWHRTVLNNVALNGQTLELHVAQPSIALCQTLARDVAPYSGDIRNISLNNSVNCTITGAIVPERLEPQPVSDAPMVLASPLTIDATGPARLSRGEAEASIRRKFAEQNIRLLALSLSGHIAVAYYENRYYATETEAVDRMLRIMMADAPSGIETFRFLPVLRGMPQAQVELSRGTAERSFTQLGTFNLFRDGGRYMPAPMRNPILDDQRDTTYPQFSWSIFPQLRQQFFDPVNPLGLQLQFGADAVVEFLPGLRLIGQAEANLFNNFNVSRPSDSVLPHVRTDFVRYFSEGKNGISALYIEHNFRASPNLFAALRGGYLESMFAGVGGEVLYQPEGQRWALGGDIYHVQQREFNRLLGLQSYRQTTGHLTLYYASPFYNLDFAFRVGRYLAGDWGTTVQVSRRFASGVEVGIFATKTNVTAAQFGEGSFDKGIMIRLPLSRLMPIHTQQIFGMDLRPIQRDGGQALNGDAQLYYQLQRASEAEFWRQSVD